jgi:hypothetical protein
MVLHKSNTGLYWDEIAYYLLTYKLIIHISYNSFLYFYSRQKMLTHILLWHREDSTPQVLTELKTLRKTLMKMLSVAERHLELNDVHHPLLAINCTRWYTPAWFSVVKMQHLYNVLLSCLFIPGRAFQHEIQKTIHSKNNIQGNAMFTY